ncbi:DNA-binding response regulator, OmpR family, contains REC and winged-helix (wHTH) domain [Peptostreptococcaceae bacterium pGA-8]|nr:DNA-binding response regulator, OmpR family, contains REC and winged-helix (wHTH) domain [Peptostreptococcaceae bacterium pGA-8]
MRLLLCEDERELSAAIAAILKHSNYSVDAVYDGCTALEYLEADNYDCVILDIMMSKIDGIEVLRKIRKNGNKIPVIMLTAKSQLDDKILGLDAGADDYLTKPFESRELLARVRAVTRRGEAMTNSILSMGNVRLDRATFALSTDSGEFVLANKEFQMLEMFMSNPQKIISADIFMDRIWGYETDTEMSVVWVYISYLRKKLSKLNANVEIKVSRNIGYSLVVKGE